MRFTDIRKTGKAVLVDMSRRQQVVFRNDYGLEVFKTIASQHWVEGVVIDIHKRTKNDLNRFIVAVNKKLIDDAKSCTDIQLLLRYYTKDIDYKELTFTTGYDNKRLLKIGKDIYYSGIDDKKIKAAIEQDRGILSLLRKDVEKWTDEDLQSFYHCFMVPNFSYRNDCEWSYFGHLAAEAADILRHARFLYGIRELSSGWNETPKRYSERLTGWEQKQRECYAMEKDLVDGFINGVDVNELKEKFEKYCISRDANRGISVEQILRRREMMADSIAYRIGFLERDSKQGKALEQFYNDLAANPSEETRNKFVVFSKTWE